jgi:hypothetical protein
MVPFQFRQGEVAMQDGLLFVYRSVAPNYPDSPGTYLRVSPPNVRTGAHIGVAMADALEGESVPVALDGIVSGYSGLTPGETYFGSGYQFVGQTEGAAPYLAQDGSVTPIANENPIGRAISDTEMLLEIH